MSRIFIFFLLRLATFPSVFAWVGSPFAYVYLKGSPWLYFYFAYAIIGLYLAIKVSAADDTYDVDQTDNADDTLEISDEMYAYNGDDWDICATQVSPCNLLRIRDFSEVGDPLYADSDDYHTQV